MEIFIKIAEKVGKIAIDQVIKETSLLSHVRDDLHWIQIQMGNLQSYLKDAEAKQVRTEGVSNFIRNIWDLAYDVEDIIDAYFPKMRLSGNRWKRLLNFRNMRIVHDFVKEVERIRKRVENLRNDRNAYGIDESSCSSEGDTWDPRKTFPHLDDPNVVGFDDLIKTLVDEVINEDSHHRVVSIIGFAGLGKTTLAKKVYNSARESKAHNSHQQRFDCAAWVCVSESPNVKMLLQDIARNVGLEEKKIENDVETNLFTFLSTKRYVIVIDDIWRTEAWDALRIGIPLDSENGSRIILTSRNKDVRRFTVHGGDNSASYWNTSSLRGVFCSFSPNLKDLKNSRYLRVLSANHEGDDIPRSVLANICKLRHLTYLKLRSDCVELPYAISNLKSLLTLDLGECFEVYLPDVIWSMKQLRHILLPAYSLACPRLLPSGACCRISDWEVNLDWFRFYPVEINLPNLQTLQWWLSGYFFKTDQLEKLTPTLKKLGVVLSSKSKDTIVVLSDLAPKFHKLEELSLKGCISRRYDTSSLNLSRYDYLSELSFAGLRLDELSLEKLPPNLTKLSLMCTWLTTDPMEALSKLQKLKFLKLGHASYSGKELICSGEPGKFPSLEEFEIRYLEDLEVVVIKEEGMPRLRKLTIGIYRDSRGPDTQVPDRVKKV